MFPWQLLILELVAIVGGGERCLGCCWLQLRQAMVVSDCLGLLKVSSTPVHKSAFYLPQNLGDGYCERPPFQLWTEMVILLHCTCYGTFCLKAKKFFNSYVGFIKNNTRECRWHFREISPNIAISATHTLFRTFCVYCRWLDFIIFFQLHNIIFLKIFFSLIKIIHFAICFLFA